MSSDDDTIIVTLENVVKRRGPHFTLETGIFMVHRGELILMSGEPRAGKSLFLSLIAALVYPDKGKVLFNQHDRMPRFGYLPQGLPLHSETSPGELFDFWKNLVDEEYPDESGSLPDILPALGLAPSDLQTLPDSRLKARKLMIAQAFLGNPELIILDDPFSGIDPTAKERLLGYIRDLKGKTAVIVAMTSPVTTREPFDREVFLAQGKILRDSAPQETPTDEIGIIYELDSDFRMDYSLELPMIPGIQKVIKLGSTKIKVVFDDSKNTEMIDRTGKMIEEYLQERNYSIKSVMRELSRERRKAPRT